ncbi:hypothetical protein LOTGIDRAFT_138665 [Lottia gigantea]|uniref:Costars domain-containing protein n=1 Tax=Lottia gigantea TaxID=225164 RepID=V4B9X0_LOTGI|nr:hypothetical protein LOTGIDRAFT_138665 [Lottia gigantea]ESP02332.1 hypothetical protein LOTGIDRAFT_138665 [Lottia gigantea]
MTLVGKVKFWQTKSDEHIEKQMINPFSEWDGASTRIKLDKNDANYGKPIPGSNTEKRGKQASEHITLEIVKLTRIISDTGEKQADGTATITFGELFRTYTRVSDKLVGTLMRARKQKLLGFDGEMLFQGRDDHVIVTLYTVL